MADCGHSSWDSTSQGCVCDDGWAGLVPTADGGTTQCDSNCCAPCIYMQAPASAALGLHTLKYYRHSSQYLEIHFCPGQLLSTRMGAVMDHGTRKSHIYIYVYKASIRRHVIVQSTTALSMEREKGLRGKLKTLVAKLCSRRQRLQLP